MWWIWSKWTDKPEDVKQAVLNNRRRMGRTKGKDLQKQRSEKVERSFAHVCETGGARRTWLRGLEKINKRYQIVAAARNLGLLMLNVFGIGKPRSLQGGMEGFLSGFWTCLVVLRSWSDVQRPSRRLPLPRPLPPPQISDHPPPHPAAIQNQPNFNGLLGTYSFH